MNRNFRVEVQRRHRHLRLRVHATENWHRDNAFRQVEREIPTPSRNPRGNSRPQHPGHCRAQLIWELADSPGSEPRFVTGVIAQLLDRDEHQVSPEKNQPVQTLLFETFCIHCRIQPMAELPFGLIGWSRFRAVLMLTAFYGRE
jgi:hypothetical protein